MSHRNILGAVLTIFFTSLSLALFVGDVSSANTIRNDFEKAALEKCWKPGTIGNRGALWFGTEPYYYDAEVVIYNNASYVNASLRGSMLKCSKTKGKSLRVIASHTYATYIDIKGDEAWRFSDLSTNTANCQYRPGHGPCMYRGRFSPQIVPFGGYALTEQGSKLYSKMNVEGLAMGDSGKETIKVGLYRCPGGGDNNIWRQPPHFECGETSQDIIIRRVPRAPWSVAVESRAAVGDMSMPRSDGSSWSNDYSNRPSTQAKVGDTVSFYHRVSNTSLRSIGNLAAVVQTYTTTSPTNSQQDAQGSYVNWSPVPGFALQNKDYSPGSSARYYHATFKADQNSSKLKYLVKSSDVGKYVCQRIGTVPNEPSAKLNPVRWRLSVPACVLVDSKVEAAANYNLQPSISVSNSTIYKSTRTVSGISSRITNSGPGDSNPANYAVVRFVLRGSDANKSISGGDGITVPNSGGALLSNWACDVTGRVMQKNGISTGALSTDCAGKELARENAGKIIKRPQLSVLSNKSNDISDIPNLNMGDKVCYMAIVNAYNPAISKFIFRYSTPVCVELASRPNVQFLGSDVRSSKDVRTSYVSIDDGRENRYYGSWAEYAIMSSGVSRSSSGAGLSSGHGGRLLTGPAPGVYNALTFSNSTSSFGGFGTVPRTALPGQLTTTNGATSVSGSVSIDSLASNSGMNRRRASGNLTITGGTIRAGRTLVIMANGDVRINGNIDYENAEYSNPSQLPQVVIMARNIIIDAGVTNVDAWLVAQGTGNNGYVSSCGPVSSPANWLNGLSASRCNYQLKIAGPVIANHLYLRRTFMQDEPYLGIPAETLNLRPDAYIWAANLSQKTDAIKTSYIREFPPRY